MKTQTERAIFWWVMLLLLCAFWFGLTVLCVGCGGSDGQHCEQAELPVCDGSWVGEVEYKATKSVGEAALLATGYVPCVCARFIFTQEEAGQYLPKTKNPDANPCGYARGSAPRGEVRIRRYGGMEPYCESLLIHELAHHYGYDHGPEMKEFEQSIWSHMEK